MISANVAKLGNNKRKPNNITRKSHKAKKENIKEVDLVSFLLPFVLHDAIDVLNYGIFAGDDFTLIVMNWP